MQGSEFKSQIGGEGQGLSSEDLGIMVYGLRITNQTLGIGVRDGD